MTSNHTSRLEIITSWIISALAFIFFLICGYKIYSLYLLNCPNQEFLTWDPELRYIITLKMMNYLREGMLFHYIGLFLDSPHWPSLRNVVESILFLIFNHSANGVVLFTFVFFLFIPFLCFYLLYRIFNINLEFAISFLFFILCLIQSDPLWLYSLTGMLEIQGAFLFPLVSFYVWKSLIDSSFISKRSNGWITFIITFLLYQTKYPYGYMLVLFLVIFEVIFHFKDTVELGKIYLLNLKKIKKKPLIWIALSLSLILLLFKHKLNGKLPGYIIYTTLLVLVIDFFLFFFKNTRNSKDNQLHFIIKWIIFPIIVWIMIQPDRFGSYSGQISHIETQGFNPGQEITKDVDYLLVFFTEFIMNSFKEFHIAYLILLGNIILMLKGIWDYFRNKVLSFSSFLSIICILTFIELSLFTSNRLARHTYHLYPSMILSLVLFNLEFSSVKRVHSTIFSILITCIVSYPFILSPFNQIIRTEICYTGYNKNDYLAPKWFEEYALNNLNKNTILYNEMNKFHVNKADSEYLLNKISYDKKLKLLIDPKRFSQLEDHYEEIWIIGNQCSDSSKFSEHSSIYSKWGFSIDKYEEIKSNFGCIKIFRKN